MKNPIYTKPILILICVLFGILGCTKVEDENLAEFSNKVASIRIVAQDTIFTTVFKTQTLKIFHEFLNGFGDVVYLAEPPKHDLYINGKRSQDGVIDTSLETEYLVQVKVGNRQSNTLTIKVMDVNPTKYISRVVADMGDSTYAPYAISGQSVVDFAVKIYNYRGEEFQKELYPPFKFWLDGKEYTNLKNIPIEKVGAIPFYAQSGEIKSDTNYLISRPKPDFSNVLSLPIIFHVVYLENENGISFNHEANEIYGLLASANETFRNQPPNNKYRSQNFAVPGIQFTLATTDTLGNKLEERGIHRIKTDIDKFPYGESATNAFIFNNMWDPEKYVNVFILNISGVGGFANLPRYQETPEDFVIPPINSNYMVAISWISTYVLVHELGHFLGLPHVYTQDKNNPCKDGDGIPDTESYYRPINKAGPDTYCGTNGFYSTNFMDAQGSHNSFTLDQALKMRSVIERSIYLPAINSTAGAKTDSYQKGKLDLHVEPID